MDPEEFSSQKGSDSPPRLEPFSKNSQEFEIRADAE
jgi:hypothetical protein